MKHGLTARFRNHTLWSLLKGGEPYVHIKNCTSMFIAALSVIAKVWIQPRCPSGDGWVSQSRHIHAMGYYSVIKRNELSSYERHRGTLNACY